MGELKVIFDKSAFHGLSTRELDAAHLHFRETITPTLIFEVLGDLTSPRPRQKNPKAKVAELAEKLRRSHGVVNDHFRNACLLALQGVGFPEERAVLPDNYFVAPTGGIIVDDSPLLVRLRRWARGHFTETDVEVSAIWRQVTRSLSFESLAKRLTREHVLLPRPSSVAEISSVSDEVLQMPALQEILLNWLLDVLEVSQSGRLGVTRRWVLSGRVLLRMFAPYAYHCLRVLLSLAVAVRHRFLRWDPTHAVDAQYLYYLPFCEIFISDDHVHRLLAPQLLGARQSFVPHGEMKASLRIAADLLDGTTLASPNFGVLDVLWRTHRGRTAPRYTKRTVAQEGPHR